MKAYVIAAMVCAALVVAGLAASGAFHHPAKKCYLFGNKAYPTKCSDATVPTSP